MRRLRRIRVETVVSSTACADLDPAFGGLHRVLIRFDSYVIPNRTVNSDYHKEFVGAF